MGKGESIVDDLEIIELFFARDERAIEETELKYGKLCHSIANRILDSREESEECVSDVLVALWNTIPPTRPNDLRAFVSKIARNLSLKRSEYLSRAKRSRDVLTSLEELEAILPDERYGSGIDEEEIGRLISEFLRTQSEVKRNVFVRKYFFFDSTRDIATRFGFSEGKVKSILFRTRNELKDYLTKEGIHI